MAEQFSPLRLCHQLDRDRALRAQRGNEGSLLRPAESGAQQRGDGLGILRPRRARRHGSFVVCAARIRPFGRAAFSAMPEMPCRRASSAQTSSGLIPASTQTTTRW